MSHHAHDNVVTITCDGPPGGRSCGTTWHGLPGQDLARCRKVAAYDGWLCKYGDMCPKCVEKMLEGK